MARRKGSPKTGGRKKGTPNKLTVSARAAFQAAFDGLGGAKKLQEWAEKNPDEFYRLYARLIPVEHVGDGGTGPISTVVKHVFETIVSPQNP